jgi:hypothetical protein
MLPKQRRDPQRRQFCDSPVSPIQLRKSGKTLMQNCRAYRTRLCRERKRSGGGPLKALDQLKKLIAKVEGFFVPVKVQLPRNWH